jgi:hypothetical protein
MPSASEGRIGFEDRVAQQYDIKSFETDAVPAGALAAVRCVVDFTKEFKPTPAFDLAPYSQGGWIRSSTGQLRWHSGQRKLDGCFTIDTAATRAVVGFAQDQTSELGGVKITPRSRYAAIYLTARDPGETIAEARSLLLVATARARNSGMKVLHDQRILVQGKPPVLMESVRADVSIQKKGTPKVTLLDHDGRRTDQVLPVKQGSFDIDGARDQTCYYLIEYAN